MGRSAEGEIKMPQASVTLAGIRSQQDEKQPGVTKQRGGWPCRIQAFEATRQQFCMLLLQKRAEREDLG